MENVSVDTTTAISDTHMAPSDYEYYLVICNISKRNNVRSLLMTAAAFGCRGVFVVGQPSFDLSLTGPASGVPPAIRDFLARGDMTLHRFRKWKEFVEHCRTVGIRLVGVEIREDARRIDAYLGGDPTAFVMGNEGDGLSVRQQADCHGFVRIPQYGGGTASLNVNVAASIVLSRVYDHQMYLQYHPTPADGTGDG